MLIESVAGTELPSSSGESRDTRGARRLVGPAGPVCDDLAGQAQLADDLLLRASPAACPSHRAAPTVSRSPGSAAAVFSVCAFGPREPSVRRASMHRRGYRGDSRTLSTVVRRVSRLAWTRAAFMPRISVTRARIGANMTAAASWVWRPAGVSLSRYERVPADNGIRAGRGPWSDRGVARAHRER